MYGIFSRWKDLYLQAFPVLSSRQGSVPSFKHTVKFDILDYPCPKN